MRKKIKQYGKTNVIQINQEEMELYGLKNNVIYEVQLTKLDKKKK